MQVDGALEEAPRSGVVAVRAQQEVDRLAGLVNRAVGWMRQPQVRLCMEVEDTGIRIESAVQARLFAAFVTPASPPRPSLSVSTSRLRL